MLITEIEKCKSLYYSSINRIIFEKTTGCSLFFVVDDGSNICTGCITEILLWYTCYDIIPITCQDKQDLRAFIIYSRKSK